MDLSFSVSPYYLIPILLVAALLSWLMYQYTENLIPRWLKIGLSTFRFVVLSLIGLLLLQPLLTRMEKLSYPPIIALLQDMSESLVINKDSAFVQSQYPEALSQFSNAFGDEHELVMYGFAGDLQYDLNPDSLQFNETGTNMSLALDAVQQMYQNQNLGAIVVVGDGIPTAGTNPLFSVEGIQQPVFTVLLGDTTPQQDILINNVLFNEIAYLENEMPIRVSLACEGYPPQDLKVTLKGHGKTLKTENIRLGGSRFQGEVSFSIIPEEVGMQQYEIEVSPRQNEISYRNNKRKIFVNVLETKVKVALFAGAPHPDLGAIKSALGSDKRYELTEFILKDRSQYYNNPNSYNLTDFDLLMLHNFPANGNQRPMVNKIANLIKDEKMPVMFFVGMFTDMRSMQPLIPYMAVSPNKISTRGEEIIVNFSRDYKQHSTYTFDDRWLSWINNSPPLFRNRSEWQPKQNADVFATAKIKNIPLDYPVFAIQQQLGRKNTVLLGENFWRMRAHSYLEQDDFELFDEWLFNNITWLMAQDDKRRFRVTPNKRLISGNEPASFSGQAYDESYNPIAGVDIKMNLRNPNGSEESYFFNETSEGQYFLDLNNLSEGTYSYSAEGRKGGALIGTDQGQFSVGRSNVEHYQLQADQDLLQQMAIRTGGEFIYARDMADLPEKLKALPGLKPVSDFQANRVGFNEFGWIMALILTLLCVEWITRKLYSLL